MYMYDGDTYHWGGVRRWTVTLGRESPLLDIQLHVFPGEEREMKEKERGGGEVGWEGEREGGREVHVQCTYTCT